MQYYLGIDLGGTAIAAGVVREDYTLVEKLSVPTGRPRAFEEIVADMARAARAVLRQAGLSEHDVAYVGLGVPSAIHPDTGRVVYACNLDWKDVDLVSEFQKNWNIPVRLGNDADCAALGEALAGAARDYDNILMVTLGTGVGGGIILNKKLFIGGDGLGIEPGHMTLVADGIPCTCGKRGCFEAYASLTALVRETISAIKAHPESAMRALCEDDFSKVGGRTAFDAAKQGDAAGLEVVRRYRHYLAEGIGSLITSLRPQAVIVGGGISNEGDYLFQPLREEIVPTVYAADIIGVPPILQAQLGNDAGIIGAALLGPETER